MPALASALAIVAALAATVALAANEKAPPDFAADYEAKVKPVLETHCFRCHNSEKKEGGLSLAQLQSGKEALEFDAWPKVTQRFINREMPPEGEPAPDQEKWQTSVRWMQKVIASVENCETLSTDVTESFYHGHVMSRRLTRSEYNNTIRDLVGLDLRPADDFPADGAGGEGFDTVGDALFTNPILMEKYLAAANRVIESGTAGRRQTGSRDSGGAGSSQTDPDRHAGGGRSEGNGRGAFAARCRSQSAREFRPSCVPSACGCRRCRRFARLVRPRPAARRQLCEIVAARAQRCTRLAEFLVPGRA